MARPQSFIRPLLAVAFLLPLATCGGDGGVTSPVDRTPSVMIPRGGDAQTAPVGRMVTVPPSVRVLDVAGLPVPGVEVVFSVTLGGGTITGAVQVTDADGVAQVGSWTLGETPGTNELTAVAAGLDSVVMQATAMAGPAVRMVKIAGDGQSAAPGTSVSVDPAVRVEDEFGNSVVGATVTFEPVLGGGSVTGGTAVTGTDGVATVGSWTLGSALGENRLRASTPGTDPVVFTASAEEGDRFDLEIRIIGSATTPQREALERARVRWEEIVQGDLVPVSLGLAEDACVDGQPAMDETVDDLVIFAKFEPIDGPGQVLGSAGPCFIRSQSKLPIVGVMNLDSDDLESLEEQGLLESVILHEMGHVLGIGTLWSTLNLLVGEGGSDPYFIGEAALDAWIAVGGPDVYDGQPVPVENTGGAGTRDGHWRETVLDRELMTGFLDPAPNPLSLLTIASLADLGYVVDLTAADPYEVPAGAPAFEIMPSRELVEVPLPEPVEVDPEGRPVGHRP